MPKTQKTRLQCRVCGHLTTGAGVRSHIKNIGHDDWETVIVSVEGKVTPAQTQA
jgi:hypothetical protein